MSDPCVATNYVDKGALGRYNLFKWLVALLLAALLLGLWGRSCQYARIGAPSLSGPAGVVGVGAVVLSGTGTPGSTIDVQLAGQSVGQTSVGTDGSWSLETNVAQPGAYTFTARALDPDGRVRGVAPALNLMVGAAGAGGLTLALPDGDVDPATVALSGSGTPGAGLTILRDGQAVGQTTVGADGQWSLTTAVERYATEFEAVELDANGAQRATSGPALLLAPAAAAPLVMNAPQLSGFAAGDGNLTQANLTVDGSGEPGLAVVVNLDGEQVGRTMVQPDGRWAYAGAIAAAAGAHSLGASQLGANDAMVGAAASAALDVTPPTAGAPTLDVVDLGDDGAAVISGAAQPGAMIDVVIDGQTVGTVTADGNGRWTYSAALTPGAHRVAAQAAGDPSRSSPSQTVEVAEPVGARITQVSGGGPEQSAVMLSGTAQPGSTVEVWVDGAPVGSVTADAEGKWQYGLLLAAGAFQVSARQSDQSATAAPVTVAVGPGSDRPIVSGALVEDATAGRVALQGTAQPGARVAIVVDGVEVDSVTADATGAWRYTASLTPGRHSVSARTGEAGGPEATPLEVALGSGPLAPGIAVATAGPLQDGQAAVTLAGSGAPDTALEIVLDDAVVGAVTTDSNGNWRLATPPQAAGVYVATARSAADATLVSGPRNVTVGPVLKLGNFQRGATGPDDSEVTLSGTATAGAQVAVVVDGVVVATVSADASGHWQYNGRLPNGARAIMLRQLDAAGNPSGETVAQSFSVGAPAGWLQVAAPEVTGDGAGAGPAVAGGPAVEIILDASWSMTRPFDGSTRFEAARQVMRDLVANSLPTGTPVALRIFGNVVGNYACRTDLMLPLATLDRPALDGILASAAPQFNANTPIAASLAQVSSDLAGAAGARLVVLLTDGEETCEGDPATEVQKLMDAGYNIQLNIVGLALEDAALKAEFARVAAIGGGGFYDAADPAGLATSLQAALRTPYRVLDASGAVVAVGQVGGAALSLPVGTYSVVLFTDPAQTFEQVVISDGAQLTLAAR